MPRRAAPGGPLTVLLAALALLWQALAPSVALARSSPVEVVTICTGAGARTVALRDGAPVESDGGAASMPACPDCVLADLQPPAPAPAEPVRFQATLDEAPPPHATPPYLSRGPPRPPARGPPALS